MPRADRAAQQAAQRQHGYERASIVSESGSRVEREVVRHERSPYVMRPLPVTRDGSPGPS